MAAPPLAFPNASFQNIISNDDFRFMFGDDEYINGTKNIDTNVDVELKVTGSIALGNSDLSALDEKLLLNSE